MLMQKNFFLNKNFLNSKIIGCFYYYFNNLLKMNTVSKFFLTTSFEESLCEIFVHLY